MTGEVGGATMKAVMRFVPAAALVVVVGSAAAAEAADERLFEDRIKPLLAKRCFGCHSQEAKKAKGGLRVDSREALVAGGGSGPALIPGHPEQSLLMRAVRWGDPDVAMPPDEADRLTPEEVRDLERWVALGAPFGVRPVAASSGEADAHLGRVPDAGACRTAAPDPGPSVVRRLTRREYVNTVADTLGVDVSREVTRLPPEMRSDGFTNTASALVVPFGLAQGYVDLAAAIADRLDAGALIARHAPCGARTARCERELVENLATRLFRRPPTSAQIERYRRLFAAAGDFRAGAKLVVRALLQAPQFLYRVEPAGTQAGPRPLDDYELAARLSYLVWGSAPDERLLERARQRALARADAIRTEVARMLEDGRARAWSRQFFGDWLQLDRFMETLLLTRPEFNPGIRRDMREETLRFWDEVVWNQRKPLWAIFTEDYTFTSKELAAFYGFPRPPEGPGFVRYDLGELPERVGILTQGTFLLLSGGLNGSLVNRGLYILENFLCEHVPPPPPDVTAKLRDPKEGGTQRTQSEQRMKECRACHTRMDPLAYALEPFDAVGQWHAEDRHGNALRSDGVFVTDDGQRRDFAHVAEFAALLAQSDRTRTCLVRKSLQFALGRPLVGGDGCTVAQIKQAFEAGGSTYEALIQAIATHPSFRMTRPE